MIPLVSSVFKKKQTNLEPLNLSSAFEHRESPQKSSVRGVVLGKLDCWLHYYARQQQVAVSRACAPGVSALTIPSLDPGGT